MSKITFEEAAALVGYHVETVRELHRRPDLPPAVDQRRTGKRGSYSLTKSEQAFLRWFEDYKLHHRRGPGRNSRRNAGK